MSRCPFGGLETVLEVKLNISKNHVGRYFERDFRRFKMSVERACVIRGGFERSIWRSCRRSNLEAKEVVLVDFGDGLEVFKLTMFWLSSFTQCFVVFNVFWNIFRCVSFRKCLTNLWFRDVNLEVVQAILVAVLFKNQNVFIGGIDLEGFFVLWCGFNGFFVVLNFWSIN